MARKGSKSSGSCKLPRNCDFKSICIILMLLVGGDWQRATAAKHAEKRGIGDSFTDGIKYAGQMFGINTAADVANLVAKAFSNAATTTTTAATSTSQLMPELLSMFFRQQLQTPNTSGESAETQEQQEPQHQATSDRNAPYEDAQPAKESIQVDFSSSKLIGGLLRMIGFDARKLGALAINALVMIAQAIGSTLLGTFMKTDQLSAIDGGRLYMQGNRPSSNSEPAATDADIPENEHEPRALHNGSPLDWYLQNPTKQMKSYLQQAIDDKLVDQLTNMIERAENRSTAGEHSAACVKMFVCKSSPFIWGMQKSLKNQLNARETGYTEPELEAAPDDGRIINPSALFTHLPSLEEYREHGAICQKRFGAHCKYETMEDFE